MMNSSLIGFILIATAYMAILMAIYLDTQAIRVELRKLKKDK